LPFAILILVAMGLVYGFFLISSLSLSMELIPEGKAGVFYALVGLGGAFGCFLGTFIAESYGFPILFVVVGVVFVLGYIAFKAYA
jgi:MFS family permease